MQECIGDEIFSRALSFLSDPQSAPSTQSVENEKGQANPDASEREHVKQSERLLE
tara:strand:- start:70 stop:234 length:165 start_codon:yes stop_codon:yes gene_type:complete